MRALILHGAGDLRLETVADPAPGPGEVVLRTECAMTCATDAKILRNGAHPAIGPVPAPFGHEVTGELVAIGGGVDGFAIGDHVVVANSAPCGSCYQCGRRRLGLCEDLTYLSGAFAEYVRVPARIVATNTLLRPADLLATLAPMIEPLACAIHAVARSGAGPDDRVVVVGGGVQGQFLTACLAARGCEVLVCDPHDERRERALRFGASATAAAPRDLDGVADVRARLNGGRGADVVFEAVGRPETWRVAVDLAAPGGEVNLYGGCPPGTEVPVPAGVVHYGELRLQGSYHHTPVAVRDAVALLRSGAAPFAELVGAPIGLEQVGAALAASGPKHPVIP